MNKFKDSLPDFVSITGFLGFIFGILFLLIGSQGKGSLYIVLGIILGVIGFFFFVYGNMLEDDLIQE